jgi:transcriptional regulator with PAS, ATPase and Fis domain
VAKSRDPNTLPGPSTQPLDAERRAKGQQARCFQLTVESGPDAGVTFTSKGERAVIGTHQSCDLVLTDTAVSRFHCDVTLAAEVATLRDLDSRNGTSVNGLEVLAARLPEAATIEVGRTRLRYGLGKQNVTVAVSLQERFGDMVGGSLPMRRAFALLERAAAGDVTVLLEGETGTGKEVAAQSIHDASARAKGPIVVVDCGAIPADLLESELFGHEKGAFTGAHAAREGAFESAQGGTVFLDEIGELALDLQPKLLRVLERREVKRVGANRYLPVDVRVITATNRNLRADVNARKFRSDLYYRLAVLEVRLPPLRERLDDLAQLVEHILHGLGKARVPEAAALRTPAFHAELARHGWPGNVRELRNYLERCLALRTAAPLVAQLSATPETAAEPAVALDVPLREAREAWLAPFERRYAQGLLERHGNIAAAARAAGVDRITFYRLLWRYGLK